jgi:S1-C subfamily serine protease
MELGDGLGDDESGSGWIPPDDRLWRHPSEVDAPASPRSRWRRAEPRLWSVALLAALTASLGTAALIVAAGGFKQTIVRTGDADAMSALPFTQNSRDTTQIEQIAERIRPSIVQVQVVSDTGKGSGSGVLFRSDGHILTSRHVIDGAKSINVVMADGHEAAAKVIGSDEDTDIAVVKVDRPDALAAPLGTASHLRVGQTAVAIGEPLGLAGGPTVTVGVISAVGRQVEAKDASLLDMIQTDAPIAPGSSGGALVDSGGAVIGITTAIAVTEVGAEGLGFATPIDIARDVADQLIATGHVVHVWLGIEGEDLDRKRAESMGVTGGAVVKGVRQDSPASQAGLSASDVILRIDGKPVTSMAGLVIALRTRKPGEVVTLDVRRDAGKPRTIKATLIERPATLK